MAVINGLETTFNIVYSEYDKWRPTYVKKLYDDIFAAKEINQLSNVLEIGIGTGQATLPILEKGCSLTYKDKEKENLHVAMQKIYAKYMPGSSIGAEFSEKAAKNQADISKKYGFVDVDYKLYRRTRTFNAKEYISLLGTYSDHIAIKKQTRLRFFNEIQSVIEDYGNSITLYDTIDLQLARKS